MSFVTDRVFTCSHMPCPPRGHSDWVDVEGDQREPLSSWEDEVNAWLRSGSWWSRWRRRRNLWIQARIEVAQDMGARVGWGP